MRHSTPPASSLLLVLVFVGLTTAAALAQTAPWAQQLGGAGFDIGCALAHDQLGNVYATGTLGAPAPAGPTTLLARGGYLMKYDTRGALLWARSSGANAYGVAVDASGNVYTTGDLMGTHTFGGTVLTGSGEAYLAKLDARGNVLWALNAGGLNQFGNGVATDAAGNAWLVRLARSNDMVLDKYSPQGQLLWSRLVLTTAPSVYGCHLGTDVAGNAYVTGSFSGGLSCGPVALSSAGGDDAFLLKYDAGGTLRWGLSIANPTLAIGTALAVAGSHVYVAGNFDGQLALGGQRFTAGNTGAGDSFWAEYDSAGTLLRARQLSGPGFTEARGIAVDAGGMVYVAGVADSSASGTAPTRTSFLARYNAQGQLLGQAYEGADITCLALSLGPGGRLATTGLFERRTLLAGTVLTARGPADAYVTGSYLGPLAVAAGHSRSSLTVHPNPAGSGAGLHLSFSPTITELRLLNNLGEVLRKQAVVPGATRATLAVAGLAPGSYLLQARGATGMVARRVVLE
jgi:hypothetical protein